MNQFLQFALQIWWQMKFLTISRKITNQLCTWLRQNIDNIYHYWVKFWAGTVISLNSRHVPPTPFISIIYWYLSLSFLFGRVGRLNSRHARHPHPLIPPARYSCLRETFRLCFRQFKAKNPSLTVGNSIYIVLIHRARSANWLIIPNNSK